MPLENKIVLYSAILFALITAVLAIDTLQYLIKNPSQDETSRGRIMWIAIFLLISACVTLCLNLRIWWKRKELAN